MEIEAHIGRGKAKWNTHKVDIASFIDWLLVDLGSTREVRRAKKDGNETSES